MVAESSRASSLSMAVVHYFAGRGRAEQARWMLAATETPFENRVLPVIDYL